jgi:hypothetical protein
MECNEKNSSKIVHVVASIVEFVNALRDSTERRAERGAECASKHSSMSPAAPTVPVHAVKGPFAGTLLSSPPVISLLSAVSLCSITYIGFST